ncbi:MAG: hypothetical protein C3F02_00750 [Parcubacteria group bacterium]|nr:MAG: hypothetical protein C3F02_00750 [Parcubacteria group bacterium]
MPRNAIIVDSSVLIHDPDAIEVLLEDGRNTLIVPWSVVIELGKLRNKPDFSLDALTAIEKLEALRTKNDSSLQMVKNPDFSGLEYLNRNDPAHQVLAAARSLNSEKHRYDNVKLVSRDPALRLLARDLGYNMEVGDYRHNQVGPLFHEPMKVVRVSIDQISEDGETFPFVSAEHEGVALNEAVICESDYDPEVQESSVWGQRFVAIRKERNFHIVPPDIDLVGLRPASMNGNGANWTQHAAMGLLKDRDVQLVFLEGVAGTGKTLLALAAGLEQKQHYKRIVITRPMIHLEDVDRMGFLPGDEEAKMSPWARPIEQALVFLGQVDGRSNQKTIDQMRNRGGLILEPLDYIRGMTYHHVYLIIDEAQNLTPHMIKTIITRAGRDTKIVFTGDLDQIDRSRVDRRSSGLAYAIKKMVGNRIVGIVTFHDTVRSPLASLGQEVL